MTDLVRANQLCQLPLAESHGLPGGLYALWHLSHG